MTLWRQSEEETRPFSKVTVSVYKIKKEKKQWKLYITSKSSIHEKYLENFSLSLTQLSSPFHP
jgi:hypothetical protein